MLRVLATKRVSDWIDHGFSAQAAEEEVLNEMARFVGSDAGIIAVDQRGGIGIAHRTAHMPCACTRVSWMDAAID